MPGPEVIPGKEVKPHHLIACLLLEEVKWLLLGSLGREPSGGIPMANQFLSLGLAMVRVLI